MSLYEKFKTNQNLEREGILLEYGKNSKGNPIQIRIARAGGSNLEYMRKLELRVKPLRRQIQNETVERTALEEILKEVFVETVVLGWENVEDENKLDMPFNRKNCLKLFTDLPDLFADLQEQAQRSALFRQDILEVDSKN